MPAALDRNALDGAPVLLPSWEHRSRQHWTTVAISTAAVHVLFAFLLGAWASTSPSTRRVEVVTNADVRRNATTLVAPITQKSPNRSELSKEYNLASLPPRPQDPQMPSPGAAARPPKVFEIKKNPTPVPVPNATLSDVPVIDPGTQLRASSAPPPLPGVQNPIAPPPRVEPEEKPKLTFERPGAPTMTPGPGRVPAPKSSIAEVIREAARASRSGGLVVGDDDAPVSVRPTPNAPALPGRRGSAVELLSDPMGVDFWPYLTRVLSSVRRNWYAVYPESARLGLAGRTVIEFAISKDGKVPKMVLASASGADALDRAAVAGISASNPFPPLPPEFRGEQIRLRLVFRYNMPQ